MRQAACALRVLERMQEIGQGREVHASAAFRRRDGETQGQMCFTHTGRLGAACGTIILWSRRNPS